MSDEPPADLVWVPGGWVKRCPTVPIEGGVVAVVAFALACWRENIALKLAALEAA